MYNMLLLACALLGAAAAPNSREIRVCFVDDRG